MKPFLSFRFFTKKLKVRLSDFPSQHSYQEKNGLTIDYCTTGDYFWCREWMSLAKVTSLFPRNIKDISLTSQQKNAFIFSRVKTWRDLLLSNDSGIELWWLTGPVDSWRHLFRYTWCLNSTRTVKHALRWCCSQINERMFTCVFKCLCEHEVAFLPKKTWCMHWRRVCKRLYSRVNQQNMQRLLLLKVSQWWQENRRLTP